jgi:hypothetical protein
MHFEDLNLLFHLCVRAAGMRFALGDALRNMDGETSMVTRRAALCSAPVTDSLCGDDEVIIDAPTLNG